MITSVTHLSENSCFIERRTVSKMSEYLNEDASIHHATPLMNALIEFQKQQLRHGKKNDNQVDDFPTFENSLSQSNKMAMLDNIPAV